jgi:hypothetical protein
MNPAHIFTTYFYKITWTLLLIYASASQVATCSKIFGPILTWNVITEWSRQGSVRCDVYIRCINMECYNGVILPRPCKMRHWHKMWRMRKMWGVTSARSDVIVRDTRNTRQWRNDITRPYVCALGRSGSCVFADMDSTRQNTTTSTSAFDVRNIVYARNVKEKTRRWMKHKLRKFANLPQNTEAWTATTL